jgi:hypothetical protein
VTARGLYRTAFVFALLGVAGLAGGYFGDWSCGIEGAYFDRSIAAPSGIVSEWGNCWAGDLLLGAGLAFLLCAATVAGLGWRVSRRAAS